MNAPVHLGVDTGGTYTDAVLWNPAAGRVVAKAKALTTHAALDRGIAAAVDRVMAEAAIAPGAIGLVSLSTTLATNALVEGHGAPAALVMIGFEERDIARAGLREALGADPVLMLAGGHSSERPGRAARSASRSSGAASFPKELWPPASISTGSAPSASRNPARAMSRSS
ncbi:MAG: hydantoinase/oxoprolinase N-terminal domain-containing protein, partial [Pseudomonadota bacterium]